MACWVLNSDVLYAKQVPYQCTFTLALEIVLFLRKTSLRSNLKICAYLDSLPYISYMI